MRFVRIFCKSDGFELPRNVDVLFEQAVTFVEVGALVAEANDVGQDRECFEVVDGGRVDELDAHGAGELALHVDENGAAGASDGVVEDEDARRLAVHAAGAGADVGECAVEEDGASELLATREACRFGDFDEALWRCGVGIEDFCGERMGDLAHGALDEFGAGGEHVFVDERVDELLDEFEFVAWRWRLFCRDAQEARTADVGDFARHGAGGIGEFEQAQAFFGGVEQQFCEDVAVLFDFGECGGELADSDVERVSVLLGGIFERVGVEDFELTDDAVVRCDFGKFWLFDEFSDGRNVRFSVGIERCMDGAECFEARFEVRYGVAHVFGL